MMLIIDGNNIQLTRGNTALLDITILKDDEPYTMKSGDLIELAIKRRCEYNNVVLNKISSTNQFELDSKDTAGLAIGDYVYSVTFSDDEIVDTFITGTFTILCEVME